MKLNIGTRKGLFQFELDGSGIRSLGPAHLGDPVTYTRFDARTNTLWACMSLGHFGPKLRRSGDGGKTWEEVPTPQLPEPESGKGDTDAIRGDKRPQTLGEIWCLETGLDDQPGRLWLGAMPGVIFRSDDNGDSWQLMESLHRHPDREHWFGGGADHPVVHSILVDPRDGRRILAGVSCGGVWLTEDEGATWECKGQGLRAEYMPPEQAFDLPIQDPHRLSSCAARPDRVWCQHHNGMFRSDDGGCTWVELQNVKPSNFGFATVAHPRDPDTAWFVPAGGDSQRFPVDASVVVNHTQDGGMSFKALTNGLPKHDAYDLVLRHALDCCPQGEFLALGSSTGSLWVSRDGGGHFELVNAHLPPIYSVEIAPVH